MAVILVVLAAFALIGAVVYGVIRNNRSTGAPTHGTDADGTPRKSS